LLPSPELAIEAALIVTGFAVISYVSRIVDRGGLLAGLLVGYVVYVFGGRFLFMPLLAFHLSAGVFTKYKYEEKRRKGVAEEKIGARGWRNVLANGGIAALFASAAGVGGSSVNSIFLAGFLGAIGTAAADTAATELGLLYKNPPRLITDLKTRVPAGTPGGVSMLGEAAQILTSVLVTVAVVVFMPFAAFAAWAFGITTVASFAGSTVDSLIGATGQTLFRCEVCGRTTEKRVHCGQRAVHIRGKPWLDNNIVNLFATGFGALVAVALHVSGALAF